MKIIKINTQAELDALPMSFDGYTQIQIFGGTVYDRIIIRGLRKNSSVVARGNSSVAARENSSVVAWDNSSVEAWDNSSVVARGNSSVEARDNSSVEARDNSSVEAWGNSSVKVYSSYVDLKKIKQESVIICIDCKIQPKEIDKTATILFKVRCKKVKVL